MLMHVKIITSLRTAHDNKNTSVTMTIGPTSFFIEDHAFVCRTLDAVDLMLA